MNIVVGLSASPESEAAVFAAVDEAALRGAGVMLLQANDSRERGTGRSVTYAVPESEVTAYARKRGVSVTARSIPADAELGEALIDLSYQEDTAMVVLGLQRRSPVGKLFLGSTSQRVLLEAGCPVHTVKVRVGPRR